MCLWQCLFLGNFAVESDLETFLSKENEMKAFHDKIDPNSLQIITRASVARPYFSSFVSFVCCSRQQLFCGTFVTLLCFDASFIRLQLQTTCLNAPVLCSVHLLFQSTMSSFGAHFSSYTTPIQTCIK